MYPQKITVLFSNVLFLFKNCYFLFDDIDAKIDLFMYILGKETLRLVKSVVSLRVCLNK